MQTGEWPLPPDEFGVIEPNQFIQNNNMPVGSSSTAHNIAQVTSQVSSSSPSEQIHKAGASGQAFPTKWQLAWSQKRMPGSPEPVETGSPQSKATGYRYRASAYWEFACQLLANYQARTGERIERDFDGCKLTLAVIVAWLRFPLFGGGAGREWMTLGLEKLRQEVGMKNERLMDCLTQLQEIRLLQPFRAIIPFGGKNYPGEGLIGRTPTDKEDEGKIFVSLEEFSELKAACADLAPQYGGGKDGYWQQRSIQKTNNFYRFKPSALLPREKAELDVLPIFNPFDLEQLASVSGSKSKKVAVAATATTSQETTFQPGSTLPETREVPTRSGQNEAELASSQDSSDVGSTWEALGKYVRHIPQEEGSTSNGVGTYFPASQRDEEGLPIKETGSKGTSEVLPTPSCFKEHVHVVVDDKEQALVKQYFQATPETGTNQGSKGDIAATLPQTLGETLLAQAHLQLNEPSQAKNGYSPNTNNSSSNQLTNQEHYLAQDTGGSLNTYEPKSPVEKLVTSKQPTLASNWYERRLARLSEEKLTLHNIFLHLVEVLGCEDIGMPNMSPLSALELAEQYELAQVIRVIEGTKAELARGKVRDNPIGLVIVGLERGFVPGDSSREEVQVALAADQRKKRASYRAVPPTYSSASTTPASGSTYSRPHEGRSYRERTSSVGKGSAGGSSKNRAGKPYPIYPTDSTGSQVSLANTTGLDAGVVEASPGVACAGIGNTPESLSDQSGVNRKEDFFSVASWNWEEVVSNLAHRASYNGFGSVEAVQELLQGSQLALLSEPKMADRSKAETTGGQVTPQVQVVLEASWKLASLHEPARQAIGLELRRLAPGCQVSFASRGE